MRRYQSPSGRLWRKSRNKRKSLLKRLFAKHGGICAHCGGQTVRVNDSSQPANLATSDHVIPRSELPFELWFDDEHAVLSCLACNQRREQEMTRRKNRRAKCLTADPA